MLGHRDRMEDRVGETYGWEGFGAHEPRGSQANPRLRSPPPALPQTLFLVAWSILRRSLPGTGWGAALLLHCEWSGLHLGRSETQRIQSVYEWDVAFGHIFYHRHISGYKARYCTELYFFHIGLVESLTNHCWRCLTAEQTSQTDCLHELEGFVITPNEWAWGI